MSKSAERLLPPKTVAEILDVTEDGLAMWRRMKQGPPYVRVGHRTVRYPYHKLLDWIAEREVRHA